MEQKHINQGGGLVLWSPGPANREQLAMRLGHLGLAHIVPAPAPNTTLLKAALVEYCEENGSKSRKRSKLVQPHHKPKENGFEVVDVERDERRNDYTHDFSANVDENGTVSITGGYADRGLLQSKFNERRLVVSSAAIGQMLVDVATEHLDGISLRQSGGVYWLPEGSINDWKAIASAVEQSAVKDKKIDVYLIRTVMDEDGQRVVHDNTQAEILSAVGVLYDELTSGTLGEKALETRKTQAERMVERVERYSSILGDQLSTLKKIAAQAESAVISASLQQIAI